MKLDLNNDSGAFAADAQTAKDWAVKFNYTGKYLDDIRQADHYLPYLCQIASAVIQSSKKDMTNEELADKAFSIMVSLRNKSRNEVTTANI